MAALTRLPRWSIFVSPRHETADEPWVSSTMPKGIEPPSHTPHMPRLCGRMAAKSRSAHQRLRVISQAAAARHRRRDGRGDGSGGGGGAAHAIEDPKNFARLRRAELFSRLRRAQAAPAAHGGGARTCVFCVFPVGRHVAFGVKT